ncbi:MAG: hypothetical protein H6718_11915 [Polyangiaceae bacterium]|nr:hypothetical protein [Polyangiaceae bacterium]MCB9608885.1 hypothetical protein [Polyangiaceae bacterium]
MFRAWPLSIAIEPSAGRSCELAPERFGVLGFVNACVLQDRERALLYFELGAEELETISLVRGTNSVFLELEAKHRVYRRGERDDIVGRVVVMTLPLSIQPGDYQLRVNDTCLPFRQLAPSALPRLGPVEEKRTCWNDRPIVKTPGPDSPGR